MLNKQALCPMIASCCTCHVSIMLGYRNSLAGARMLYVLHVRCTLRGLNLLGASSPSPPRFLLFFRRRCRENPPAL